MRTNKPKAILPFRWAGGKYYALRKLQPFWANIEHDEYREPFLGGGAVFWAKPKAKYNWLNDIDKDLIFTLTFICIEENRNKLLKLFEEEKEATREHYEYVKHMVPTDDLSRAYQYYYLNRTSFSGKMRRPTWGYRPKRSLPPYRWRERIVPCAEKLRHVLLTALDFQEVITAPAEGENVLIFLDPPYFGSRQEDHYAFSFTEYDHVRLATLLKKTHYNFFLTYDNCPQIREIYNWAYLQEISFYYRIDNSQDSSDKRKVGNELVITNYPLQQTDSVSKQFKLFSGDSDRNDPNSGISNNSALIVKTPIIEKIRSPIRFPGSKYQAIKYIAPFWECVEHDEYREPFLGGGAIFFAKPLAQINWLNDIDKELIMTFQYFADREKRKSLKTLVQRVNPSREMFEELKNSKPKDDLETVFRYFVINRTAYSGIMNKPNWGYHTTKSVQPHKWPDRIEQAGQKLEHSIITNLDYEFIITSPAKGKSVFLFVDPPYIEADQKRAYFHSFRYDDHLKLVSLLKDTRFKFCLTYDDCDKARKLYSWANIHEFSWRYHTANSNTSKRKMGNELIITNY